MRKKTALDPAGHLSLSVRNFAASKRFYSKVFNQIGFEQISSKEKSASWTTREGFGVWIKESCCPRQKFVHAAPGLGHLCFKAIKRKDVDLLYALLVKEKARVLGPPRLLKEYLPHYYAVYFLDPDGIKLEYAYY